MSIDLFIKFDGVDGESIDKEHKGCVELQSFHWGVDNHGNPDNGGMALGKGDPGPLTITGSVNKASSVLVKKCADGKHFDSVTLFQRKSGDGQKDFYVVKMKEVYVTSISHGSSGAGALSESVTLIYGDIETEYKPQDEKGVLGSGIKFGWNRKTNETR